MDVLLKKIFKNFDEMRYLQNKLYQNWKQKEKIILYLNFIRTDNMRL